MRYNFKININTSAVYGTGNNGDWDVETEEIDVYVDNEEFETNEDVREMYADIFSGKYGIPTDAAYKIIDDNDLWFVDDDMVNVILNECVDDLKEIFKDIVEETIEDYFYEMKGD